MIKPIFRTLSLSFATVTALAASSFAATPVDNVHVARAAKAAIDRGWEGQQRLIEERLAEKMAEGLAVPGAIIVAPFKAYAPYRTDVPAVAASRKAPKAAWRGLDETTSRH